MHILLTAMPESPMPTHSALAAKRGRNWSEKPTSYQASIPPRSTIPHTTGGRGASQVFGAFWVSRAATKVPAEPRTTSRGP